MSLLNLVRAAKKPARSDLVRVHTMPLRADQWWACQYPDTDPRCRGEVYDERCPLCQNKASKALAELGDVRVYDAETGVKGGKLRDLVGWGLTEWK